MQIVVDGNNTQTTLNYKKVFCFICLLLVWLGVFTIKNI